MAVASDLRAELLRLIPDDQRVSTSPSVLDLHGDDLSHHSAHRPDAVVFAQSTEEVSRVLAFASRERIPVVPFGTGTSLEGHVIPTHGGISLDVSRMDSILALHAEDLQAVVQPGVTRLALNAAAGEYGLQFPVDPGADASLG